MRSPRDLAPQCRDQGFAVQSAARAKPAKDSRGKRFGHDSLVPLPSPPGLVANLGEQVAQFGARAVLDGRRYSGGRIGWLVMLLS